MDLVLEKLRDKYEDNDRIASIYETSMNGGRIPALQVDAKHNDMPYALMYDLFHPDGEFIGDVVPFQVYAGLRHNEAGESVAVPVLYLVSAGYEVREEMMSDDIPEANQ